MSAGTNSLARSILVFIAKTRWLAPQQPEEYPTRCRARKAPESHSDIPAMGLPIVALDDAFGARYQKN